VSKESRGDAILLEDGANNGSLAAAVGDTLAVWGGAELGGLAATAGWSRVSIRVTRRWGLKENGVRRGRRGHDDSLLNERSFTSRHGRECFG
jgi:hypothetical protein